MPERSAVTAMPVLPVPGVTVTVSSVVPPEVTVDGFAAPVALSTPALPNEELRGFGAPAVKSAALLLVSALFALRLTEVVLLGAGVGPLPSKQFAVVPNPTKSIMVWPVGQLVPEAIAAVPFTSATLPAVALRLILPIASGVGSGWFVTVVPSAS